ncbi:MAG: MaoC family dehydratase [Sphingobium sp.]
MDRYLEDFAVGQRFGAGGRLVERDEVIAFAERYDPQPFHLSDEGAADTYFGRLAASGWQTCAMTMGLMLSAWGGGTNRASLGSPGVDELRWLRPVYPGDVLRMEIEITEVTPSRSRGDMGSVKGRVTTYNQDDEAVLTFRSIGLYRRRETREDA